MINKFVEVNVLHCTKITTTRDTNNKKYSQSSLPSVYKVYLADVLEKLWPKKEMSLKRSVLISVEHIYK